MVCIDLFNEIALLHQKLDRVENKLDNLLVSSGNMDNHISFVENVYESVKQPFCYILNQFSTSTTLPSTDSYKSITNSK